MEKAILKTLNYMEYPMKAYEIHKWLINKKATLFQVEKGLEKLIQKRKIQNKGDFYFLSKRKFVDTKSANNAGGIKLLSYAFKILPSVKLVGISEKEVTKLTIITENKSLLFLKVLMNFLGINIKETKESGKNHKKNLQNAVAVLKMKPIFQRDGTYSKYLMENEWVFKFFPNWIARD